MKQESSRRVRSVAFALGFAAVPLTLTPTAGLSPEDACASSGSMNTCCPEFANACPGVGANWYDKGCSGKCSEKCPK
jgi:hypothetical protein